MLGLTMRIVHFFVLIALSVNNPCSAEDGTVSRSDNEDCSKLTRGIRVVQTSSSCGGRPAVVLSGSWQRSFSAAFRWQNGKELEDRSPYDLDNPSASSSPYKSQSRIRRTRRDILCYGNFLNDDDYPLPVQLTIKRSTAGVLDRFCVKFSR